MIFVGWNFGQGMAGSFFCSVWCWWRSLGGIQVIDLLVWRVMASVTCLVPLHGWLEGWPQLDRWLEDRQVALLSWWLQGVRPLTCWLRVPRADVPVNTVKATWLFVTTLYRSKNVTKLYSLQVTDTHVTLTLKRESWHPASSARRLLQGIGLACWKTKLSGESPFQPSIIFVLAF